MASPRNYYGNIRAPISARRPVAEHGAPLSLADLGASSCCLTLDLWLHQLHAHHPRSQAPRGAVLTARRDRRPLGQVRQRGRPGEHSPDRSALQATPHRQRSRFSHLARLAHGLATTVLIDRAGGAGRPPGERVGGVPGAHRRPCAGDAEASSIAPLSTWRPAPQHPRRGCASGKVLVDEPGERLFIADTNHHRIVVMTSTAPCRTSSVPAPAGYRMGPLARRLNRPQGMARWGAPGPSPIRRTTPSAWRICRRVPSNGRR